MTPALRGLHSAEHIKDFLTKPTSAANRRSFRRDVVEQLQRMATSLDRIDEATFGAGTEEVQKWLWKVPSAYAAIMLVIPMTLLRVALNAFLIGLGVYLGKISTARLIPSYGKGSIGILVFCLVSSILALFAFYISRAFKQVEDLLLKHWRQIRDDHRKHCKDESHSTEEKSAPTDVGKASQRAGIANAPDGQYEMITDENNAHHPETGSALS
ncbi:hypothetical protein IQ06DRAFT_18914 [Phaeosphaeriaceae sp. SRC1lsM3a]|nr:hypothetical protein IQ06DRAFT_18914 [Stagonospora sp. SRC1lsM3a]